MIFLLTFLPEYERFSVGAVALSPVNLLSINCNLFVWSLQNLMVQINNIFSHSSEAGGNWSVLYEGIYPCVLGIFVMMGSNIVLRPHKYKYRLW